MKRIRISKKLTSLDINEISPEHANDTPCPPRRNLPKVLRAFSLLIFSAIVIILCLLVALLWQLSRGPERLQVIGINHYILTYGPTAILIWLVAFWRQVDFHVKELAPWTELSSNGTHATKSVLLDYVSILQVAAFWSAVRNHHFPVIITTLGFTLLKLATLSSTGLLLVESYDLQENATTTLESNFVTPFIGDNNNTALSDQSLLYTTYGVLARNLSKPFGLGEGLAYSTFRTDSKLENSTNLTVGVEGFIPSFQCRTTDLTAVLPLTNSTDAFPETIIQINNSECTLRAQDVALYTLNPQLFSCPARQLSGLVVSIDCPDSVFGANGGAYKLLVIADFRYSQELNGSDINAQLSAPVKAINWSTEIANMTGLICRLSYSMQEVVVSVSKDNTQEVISISAPSAESTQNLSFFSDDDLDRLFRASLSASDGILGDRTEEGYELEYPDPMLKVMASVSGGTYEDLLDKETMARTANVVSTQLAAQIAHQYLRHNESTPINMKTIHPATNLEMATIPTCILLISLVSIAALCLCLIPSLRGCNVDLKQGTLMCAASLMHHKSDIAHDLVKSQKCTKKQIHRALHEVNVYVVQDLPRKTELRLENSPTFPVSSKDVKSWWNPFTVSPITLTILFVSTLTAMIVLEVLQRVSNKNNGFTNLSSDSTTQTIFTHYIPALFFLLLASLYNCLDFNAVLLRPFQQMRTSVSVQELRGQHQLGMMPIFAWFRSLQKRSWGTLSSSSAALIGSLLTVVVSGLFKIETSYSALPVSVVASDSFTPEWTNSGLQDNGASLVSSLTENLNFTYPPGTFQEIAYPSLQFQKSTDKVENSSVTLQLPLWRAHLQCEVLPRSDFDVRSNPSPIQNSVTINASYSLPVDCARGGPNGSDPNLDFIQTFPFAIDQNSTYLGKLLDLHVGPYDPIQGSAEGETIPSAMNDNPLGCPSIALIYGYVDLQTPSSASDGLAKMVTVEVCYQQIQSIQATMNFLNSNFDLDTANPPQIEEASVEYVSITGNASKYVNNSESATNLSFRIQSHLDQNFVVFNNTNGNVFSDGTNLGITVDHFFQGVLFGRTPVSFTTLKQEDENQTTQLKQAILSFYRRYMAQAISSNMRVATDPSQNGTATLVPSAQTSFLANATTAVVTKRIVQHNPSKLVLQVMLGIMLICGIFTASTVQMHNLLPACANPCTIWGQMSLWAGSNIYEIADDEDMGSTGPSLKWDVTDDACIGMCKLGWWTTQDGEQRYGIDVVPKSEV